MKDLLKKAKEMKNKKNMNKDLKVQTKVFKETKEENKFKDKKDKLVCSNKHFCVSANKLSLNKGIEFETGSCKVKILPIVEKQVKGKFLNDKLIYKNYNGKDDLQYTFLNNKLKENIIIKEKREEYFFEFNLELTNVELLEELGEYYFVDNKTNNKVIKLNQFVMSDSNKQLSLDIESTLTKVSNNLYKLTLKPNKEWLNDKNRVFPVYLDPTLESLYKSAVSFLIDDGTKQLDEENNTQRHKVGFIDDKSYSSVIILNMNTIKSEISNKNLTNYRVLLNFKIAEEVNDPLSQIYCIYDEDEIIYEGKLSSKTELTLDVTKLVKKAISNNKRDYYLSLRNAYINPESSSENSAEIIENDYIYVYDNRADEEYLPSLTLEYRLPESAPSSKCTRIYSNGNAGTATVNVTDGTFIHEFNVATIKENALQIPLNMVFNFKLFNETSIDKVDKHLGKGWKTNLHQYLIKDETYDESEQCRFVNYIDGKGYRHIFKEKWFYEVDGTKYYVDKKDVCFGDDGELEYNGHKVTYEVENEDNLSLVSYSSMYNYKQKFNPTKQKRYYIFLKNKKMYLYIDKDNNVMIPRLGYKTAVNSVDIFYPEYVDIDVGYDGRMYYNGGYQLYCYELLTTKILENQEGKKYFNVTFKYENQEAYSMNYYLEEEETYVNNEESILSESLPNEEIYEVIENLKTIDKYINQNKKQIEEYTNVLELSFEELSKNSGVLKGTDFSKDLFEREYSNQNNALLSNVQYLNKLLDLIDNLNYYNDINETLKNKKIFLENMQFELVNDYIVDNSGNILGFDGYGRLILVQDKYENAINIEYGFEDESNKILSVFTKKQKFVFNYDETTSLLSNITHSNGKPINFVYDEAGYMTQTTLFTSHVITFIQTDNQFHFTNTLGTRIAISFMDNKIDLIGKIQSKYTIENGALNDDDSNTVVILKEKYYYDDTDTKTVTIRDITSYADFETNYNDSKFEKYVINNFGNVVNYIDKKGSVTILDYNKKGKLLHCVTYKEKLYTLIDASTTSFSDTLYKTVTFGYGSTYNIDLSQVNIYPFEMYGVSFKLKNVAENCYVSCRITNGSTFTTKNLLCKNGYEIIAPCFNSHNSISSIDVEFNFMQNLTLNNIEEVSLVKLKGETFSYDSNGYLSNQRNGKVTNKYTNDEDGNILKLVTIQNSITTTTTYNYNNEGLIVYCEDSFGNCVEYEYNEKEDLITKKTYNKANTNLCNISRYEYDDYGNATAFDGLLKDCDGTYPSTKLEYIKGTSQVEKITNPNKQVINYSYDYHTDELKTISSSDNGFVNQNNIDYSFGLIESLSSNGSKYTFAYDSLGRTIKVSFNGTNILNTEYLDRVASVVNQENIENSSVVKNTYALGMESFVYDEDGKIREEVLDDSIISYIYDDEDRISQIYCNGAEVERYSYNSNGTINMIDGNITKYFSYDNYKRVVTRRLSGSNFSETETFTYLNNGVSSISKIQLSSSTINYEYDAIHRPIKEDIIFASASLLTNQYQYLQYENKAIDLIKEHVVNVKNKEVNRTTYDYDVSGNIIKEESDNNSIRYKYDKLNRLIREDNKALNKTFIMKYDTNGNILCRAEYEYSLEDTPTTLIKKNKYSYNKDMLMSFNDEQFEYDVMGRPTIFRGKSCHWSTTRILETINLSETEQCIFKHDGLGIRNAKYSSNMDADYLMDGNKVYKMILIPNNEIQTPSTWTFRYSLDKVIGFNYNGSEYVYQRNIQGDITHIYRSNGELVCQYIYDAFGNHKVLTTTGVEDTDQYSIGNLNPFRYRGYFYDVETQLYWVSSRYYSPELCRWISPDSIEYLDPQSINGLNLYAYCGNDPVNRFDPTGHSWESFWNGVGDWFSDNWVKLAIGAGAIALGVLTMGAATLISGAGMAAALSAMGTAAVSSLIQVGISTAISAGIGFAVGGITSGSWEGAVDGMLNGIADGFMWGGIFAGAGQVLSGAMKITRTLAPNFNGAQIGRVKLWSPNAAGNPNTGGTLIKFGRFNRIDSEIGNMIHIHLKLLGRTINHFPIGMIAGGVIGGF